MSTALQWIFWPLFLVFTPKELSGADPWLTKGHSELSLCIFEITSYGGW